MVTINNKLSNFFYPLNILIVILESYNFNIIFDRIDEDRTDLITSTETNDQNYYYSFSL